MKRDARSRLTRYVLGDPLAPTLLANLDKSALANWRERVAGSGLATATVMRVSSDLKAALNAAHRRSEKGLPPTFPLIVKDGLAVPSGERQPHGTPLARADQILSIGDVRRLVSASRDIDSEQNWSGDLARLIIVLAATGARFSQAAALKVGDVQVPERRIMVPVSSKGRGAKPVTHTPVAVTADVIDALLPVLIGRKAGEPLLERWRHRQVKGAEWVRERRGPWLSASEITRPWAEIVARAGLAKSLVPYCLRHSSIVRGLRANLPVRHVASLHDTSASMVERHYSAFIVSALDELAASVAVSVANELPEANVVPLSRSG
jgi:integrase